jgi:hypothetical protein
VSTAITNTLTAIMPKILARALMVLRERAIMPRIVNGDYSIEAAQKGSTIDVPVPTAKTASNVTTGETPPVPSNTATSTVQITLENWQKVNFALSDKDLQYIDANAAFLPMELGEAARALANAINATIFAEYKGVYGYCGDSSLHPFATTVTDATDSRKVLNQQLAPLDSRRGVVNYTAEANMLALAAFSDAEKVMSNITKIEGEIGRKFGIDWVADDAVPTHTAGTITTGLIAKAAQAIAVGAKTCNVTTAAATGAVALLVGDIIEFAGDSQTYTVTAACTQASAASDAVLTFEPGKVVVGAGSEAITVKDSHVVNLIFHRDAFAFAMRPLVQTTLDLQLGNQILALTDPVTGLALRLEVSRQYKQTMWELDALWGAKLVRPALACRLAGKP